MAQQNNASIKPKTSSAEKPHSHYILLVEDEPTHVAVMSHTIRAANPSAVVKVAGSLKEYRSAISKSLPDIALIDMHLPDGKALEVLTSPLEAGSFPIVVMTSSGDEKTAVKAMKAGALDYIVKSTETFKAMPHTIERALNEWKLIQQRKQAEQALSESELRFRTLYENVAVGLYRTTPAGKILLANRALVKMLGYSSFEQLSERNLAKYGFSRTNQRKEFLRKIETEGEVNDFESTWNRQDGSLIFVRESARAIRDAQGKTLYYDGTVEDITERRLAESASRHAENALRRVSRLYATLSQVNHTIVRVKERDKLFQNICSIAVKVGQFRMAWIGLFDKQSGNVNPVVHDGYEEGYLQHISINISKDNPFGRGSSGQALRDGKIITNDNSQVNHKMSPWREEALKRGYLSSAVVPFYFKGQVFGLLNLYATEAGFFTDEELGLLEEIGANISFALDSIASEIERKEGEETIRVNEEIFRHFMDHSPIYVFFKDENIRALRLSKNYESMLGKPISDLLGKNMNDLFPSELAKTMVADDKRIMNEGKEITVEEEFNGRRYSTIKFPIIIEGKPRYLAGYTIDITNRKRAEEALQESEKMFRVAFDNAPTGMSIIGPDGITFLAVNPLLCEMFGYTKEELLGYTIKLVTHPDDEERSNEWIRKKYNDEPCEPEFEKRYIHKDGHVVWGLVRAQWIKNEDGSHRMAIAHILDITKRKLAEEALKKSEAQLTAFMNFVPDLILIKDHEFRPIFANEKYSSLFPIQEWMGKKPGELFKPEVAEIMIQKDTEAMEKGYVNYEETWLDQKGVRHTFYTQKFKISIPGSQPLLGSIISDITERKRMGELLEYERNLLRTLVDTLPDKVYIKDCEGRFIVCNKAAAVRLGASNPEEVIGKSDFDLLPHDLAVRFHEDEQEIIRSGKPLINHEEPLDQFSGTTRWNLVSKVPFRDKQGIIKGIVGSGRDITEQKQTEKMLRENEQFFRLLFTTSPDSILLFDPYSTDVPWKIFDCNEVACRMNGYTRDELIGKSVDMLNTKVSTVEEREAHFNVLQVKGVAHFETLHRHRDGHIFHIEVATSLVTLRGQQLILGIDRDITERKQVEQALQESELRFRSLYENTTIGLYRTTPDGKILLANPALVRMLGYASFPDLTERNLEKNGFESFNHRKEFLEKIERDGEVNGFESKWICQDGKAIFVLESARTIRDAHGKTLFYDGTVEDITKRKLLEEHLRQIQKLEGLGTLAGGIAHDFNNILGIILAYTSSIERSKGDIKKLELATGTITKAVERGSTLVRQILTFARKTETEFKAVNVNDVAMEILSMILETFPKLLTYSQNFDQAVPFINADRSQLHQALLNLCVNARDAMPTGGLLTISTRMVSAANLRNQYPEATASSYVCVEVSDTGEGMSEDTQKRIFEPFFTTKGIGKGTGLGLSVVFGIIQSHHGYIDVETELGKGTTFRMYMPVSKVAEPISEKNEETLEEIPGGTETVLIVEDEQMLLMSLQMVLEEKGYNVITAEDGLAALKIYQERENDIALVLTDLGLPNITGLEVCQRIKIINRNEHIILATGFLDPDMKSEFLKAGIEHFLYKPYDLRQVLKMMRKVLDEK